MFKKYMAFKEEQDKNLQNQDKSDLQKSAEESEKFESVHDGFWMAAVPIKGYKDFGWDDSDVYAFG